MAGVSGRPATPAPTFERVDAVYAALETGDAPAVIDALSRCSAAEAAEAVFFGPARRGRP